MKSCLVFLLFCHITLVSGSQVTWDGGGDGVSWNDPNNWTGDNVPAATDNVVLDNSLINTSYTVGLPAGAATVTLLSLTITPSGVNTITLNLPAANTAAPGLAITGTGDALVLNSNAVFRNSSGASSGSTVDIVNTFRINNGGHYIHNTARGNASIVSQLSTAAGTESGEFEFDVPVASYTPSLSGRNYGSLTFNAVASGGAATYIGGGASTCTVRGNLTINSGVIFSLSMSANFVIQQGYTQFPSSTFNLQSSTNNNTVRIAGDIVHDGIITESNAGLPRLELNGTAVQLVSGTGLVQNSVTFVVNNPAGITLGSALALPYNLTLTNGKINSTAVNLLTLLDNATVSGSSATSFVNGPMKKTGDDPFVFPIGKGSILAPVAVSGGTGSAVTDEFTTEYIRSNPQSIYGGCPIFCTPGLDHISSVEYWNLERNAGTASKQVTLTVHALSFCKLLASTYVSRRDLTQWSNEPTTISFGPVACGTGLECGTLTTTGALASFGVFTLATDQPFSVNPLPIRLSSFVARKQSSTAALISWELAEACSKDASFEVQRSSDGRHFSRLLELPGNETSLVYSITDNRLDKGMIWYRLKMTDENGTVSYSRVVVIINDDKGILITSVFPNPAKENAMILLNAAQSGRIGFELYNITGQKLRSWLSVITEGSNNIPLSLAGLPAGIYHIIASGQQAKAVARFVKQ